MSFQNTEQPFFGRSLKVRIELEDVQPQDNFRLKAKRGGDIGGQWEVLLIHFEFFPMNPLRNTADRTYQKLVRGLATSMVSLGIPRRCF